MTFVGILRELSEQSYSFCNLPPPFMWILSGRKHEAESDDELQDDDLCHELFQDYLSGVPKLELYTSMYLCYLKIEDGGLLRYRWCGQYWSKKTYNRFYLSKSPTLHIYLTATPSFPRGWICSSHQQNCSNDLSGSVEAFPGCGVSKCSWFGNAYFNLIFFEGIFSNDERPTCHMR